MLRWVSAFVVVVGAGAAIAAEHPSPSGGADTIHRSGSVERVEHQALGMAQVSAGIFVMGFDPEDEDITTEFLAECLLELGERRGELLCTDRLFNDAGPQREVFLHEFDIDRHEVIVDEYRECVADGACDVGAVLSGDTRHILPGLPMVNVTWQDATDYCHWVGKRLPTEAEWEKAARGTDGRKFPWGNQDRADDFNHGKPEALAVDQVRGIGQNGNHLSFRHDASDGAKYAAKPGAMVWSESPYGVYDLAGNVFEWVQDYYFAAGYKDLPTVSPVRMEDPGRQGSRVIRGGSWQSPIFLSLTWTRTYAKAEARSSEIGFRCARDRPAK